ncbi:MAG: BspA family leucine-rich repeat surface protein, partial [Flammeovirgaceae bacterium]
SYDSTLMGWATQTLPNNLNLGADGLIYCSSRTARQSIIDNANWTFTGDANFCEDDAFVTTWQTPSDNYEITIPVNAAEYSYNYTVDWGDGTLEAGFTGNASHTYATAGNYTVKIHGLFPAIYFRNFVSNEDSRLLRTVEQWGDNEWLDMKYAFAYRHNLEINATDAPDLFRVTDMSNMFVEVRSGLRNSAIGHWNTSNVVNMSSLFFTCLQFNGDISGWNTSRVINMSRMFAVTSNFNQDIGGWNTSRVTSMRRMFDNSSIFNQDIGKWNTSNVQDMQEMFASAREFNQDISEWNTSRVTNMIRMFEVAIRFNQDIGKWNTSNVQNMRGMFSCAARFNQSLAGFNMEAVSNVRDMLNSTRLSVANYDRTLFAWSKQNLQNGLRFDANGIFCITSGVSSHAIRYCNAASARQYIIDTFGWNIRDDGQNCNGAGVAFETTWETTSTNESITIPTNSSYTYNYTIDWGDGQTDAGITGDATHTYASAGTYTVKITRDFPAIFFNGGGDRLKIKTIEQWGSIGWEGMAHAFNGCNGLQVNATDVPELSQVTSLSNLFKNTGNLVGDFSNWDVSTIQNFAFCFNGSRYNQDISNWDVSNGTAFFGMFWNAPRFNQDISGWEITSANNLGNMFLNAVDFDQNLGNWKLATVTNLSQMFSNSGMSTANYDSTLMGWSTQTLPNNLTLGADGLTYCNGASARAIITDNFNWTFSGDAIASACNFTFWNGSSWNNGTPTSSMNAAINGDYDTYTEGAITTNDFAIKTGATVTARGNNAITLAGNFSNDGAIYVKDTTSFIQTAASPTNSGSGLYAVERMGTDYLYSYNYWSSPVQHTSINTVFSSTGKDFYTFDANSQSWGIADMHATLQAGQGFTATGLSPSATTVIRTFSDHTGFNSGTINITPAFDGTAGVSTTNWNLIGNPYPSGLNVTQFLSDNNSVLENVVYLWSSSGTDIGVSSADYATMNSLGTVNAGGSGIAPSSATISSCQGFFVQTRASGNITFNNSQRIATNNTFQRTMQTAQRVWLNVTTSNGISNEILLGFTDDGKMGKDQYDGIKLSGNEYLSFYSLSPTACQDNQPCVQDRPKWIIQGLPELTDELVVPLGLEAKSNNAFTFQIGSSIHIPEETHIYLFDALTGSEVNLKKDNYTIELSGGTYEDRFFLRFVPNRVTALENPLPDHGIIVYPKNQQIHIQFKDLQSAQAEILIYDLMGRLTQRIDNQTELKKTIEVAQSGLWIVHIVNQMGKLSKKILITH